jgi:organic radical activating enzyme
MSHLFEKLRNSKTFCIMPWIHCATQTNGAVQLCCVASPIKELNLNNMTWDEVWNSEQYKDARLKMLSDEKVSYCTNCYKEEAAGIKSHRQNENEVWANNWSPIKLHELRKIVADTNDDGSIDSGIVSVDFRLGNTCNLQCVMCRPHDSSKWLNDSKFLAENLTSEAKWDWKHKSNIVIEQFEWYKNQKFWDSFYESAHNIRDLIFGGGEPILIKQHKELIKHLVKIDHAKNVEIRYHTNGTMLDEELLELWTHFKKAHIMVSLDAHQDLNSYIRYPAKWEDIEKHLRIYDNTTGGDIILDINCTVQALNVNYLPEFAEWIWAQDYKKIGKRTLSSPFHTATLHWPKYLCTKVLPLESKKRVAEKLNTFMAKHPNNPEIQKWSAIVDFMMSEDWSDMLDQTKDYLRMLDKIRPVQFPEIYKLL